MLRFHRRREIAKCLYEMFAKFLSPNSNFTGLIFTQDYAYVWSNVEKEKPRMIQVFFLRIQSCDKD
uniref:Putative ovule protein n=1 Tax=Solanum chacoense TaxID=4108 RepID=A0A0V0GV13_SOLCH